jgi:ankyrin repeat protein
MLYDYSMEEPIKRALRNLIPEPNNLASRSLSRLHKTVLGITLEPLNALLRSSRANINDVDSSGRSVLHWAAHMGDDDMLNAILRCGADPNLRCIAGRTPLHYAARVGANKCVASLIDAGADLGLRDKQGETALHLAADCKRNEVMKLLLEAGADLNKVNNLGEAPLAYAATENNREGVSLLLNHGASVDVADYRGYTAFLDALWANAHEVAELLISHGAATDIKIDDGMTALHFVAQQGDIRMMEILGKANLARLDQSAINTDGCTALQVLRQREDLSDQLIEAFGALLLDIERSSAEHNAERQRPADLLGEDEIEIFIHAVEHLSEEVFVDAEAY